MQNKKLTRAENYLLAALRATNLAAITPYRFFRLLEAMYREGQNLYLRYDQSMLDHYLRVVKNLIKANQIRRDNDYGVRLIRILDAHERSAEEIVCLADPLCYISHLSAMQRWGLTDRSSRVLTCTRPDRETANARFAEIMAEDPGPLPPERVRLRYIGHPETVRGRRLHVTESVKAGACVNIPGTGERLATIGQTFLDMLQHSRQCGGMSHVLDIYDKYALDWIEEIITAVDSCNSDPAKIRAGYLLEERLEIKDERIESWKNLAQRGGSRTLDPSKSYAPVYSETWMISLNV